MDFARHNQSTIDSATNLTLLTCNVFSTCQSVLRSALRTLNFTSARLLGSPLLILSFAKQSFLHIDFIDFHLVTNIFLLLCFDEELFSSVHMTIDCLASRKGLSCHCPTRPIIVLYWTSFNQMFLNDNCVCSWLAPIWLLLSSVFDYVHQLLGTGKH